MQHLHVVSHTHWDREWYRTFQQFRLQLVHLVDNLLTILDSNSNYLHFMLDGQTIVLEDYLQMRMANFPRLQKLIQENRILIGPWYILPDEFLVSPEATIRNLLLGQETAREFGPVMQIGYLPDTFGHIGQIPQIVKGFGMQTACAWRGLPAVKIIMSEPCRSSIEQLQLTLVSVPVAANESMRSRAIPSRTPLDPGLP